MKPHPDLTPKPNYASHAILGDPTVDFHTYVERLTGKSCFDEASYNALFEDVDPDKYVQLLIAHINLKWINVIKQLRAMFGMGLKEAKIFMDSIRDKSDIVNLELARMQQEYPELFI